MVWGFLFGGRCVLLYCVDSGAEHPLITAEATHGAAGGNESAATLAVTAESYRTALVILRLDVIAPRTIFSYFGAFFFAKIFY